MKIEHRAQIKIDRNTTFQDIYEAVTAAEIPPTAKVAVDKYVGDQRDPGYSHILFNWETGS